MPDGSTEDTGCWEQGLGALLRQLVGGSSAQRSAACERLVRVALPSLADLAALLRQKRNAGDDDVFLVSFRMDLARQAVRQAAVEILSDSAAGDALSDESVTVSDEDFLRRVGEIALGPCDAHGQRTGGTALELYDSERYHLNRRSSMERALILLIDEALERPDKALRSHVFKRLWQWAVDLSYAKCHDREASKDLASEAFVCLLRSGQLDDSRQATNSGSEPHGDAHGSDLPMSGVEVLRRVYSLLMGGTTERGRRWPGLIEKFLSDKAARREVRLHEHLAGADEPPLSTRMLDSGKGQHDPHSPDYVDLKGALGLCKEQLREIIAEGQIGERSSKALGVLLDVLEARVDHTQEHEQEKSALTVATIERHAVVEPEFALPALRAILPVERARSIMRRLLAVKDQLVLRGLVEENWQPRPAALQDLRRMLDDLEALTSRPEFRKYPRQRETIRAVVAYWRADIEAPRSFPPGGDEFFRLRPLVKWRRRVHIDEKIMLRIRSEMGLSPTAVQNLIKRSLDLLTVWGLVKEIRDG